MAANDPRHLMFHQCAPSGSVEEVKDDPDPDSAEEEVAEPGPGPERLADQSELLAFLNQQLDEVLIHSQPGQKEKDLGLLRKLAFVRFYIDGFSQREILKAAIEAGARLGISGEMTRTRVNNWISRGDVLKSLVVRLVEKHQTIVDKLSHICTQSPDLTDEERGLLQMEWALGKRLQQMPVSSSHVLPLVAAQPSSAKIKIAGGLFRTVKQELHQSRSRKKQRSGIGRERKTCAV
jgi:hypothetical protein